MDISKVIGMEGGSNSTWFKVLSEEGRGKTKYYPAVVNGVVKSYHDFKNLDDYLAAKQERERETIRLTIAGNPVMAEDAISKVLKCKSLSTAPHSVDVYPDEPMNEYAAAGSVKSDAKSAAARKNGKKGGRPRKEKE